MSFCHSRGWNRKWEKKNQGVRIYAVLLLPVMVLTNVILLKIGFVISDQGSKDRHFWEPTGPNRFDIFKFLLALVLVRSEGSKFSLVLFGPRFWNPGFDPRIPVSDRIFAKPNSRWYLSIDRFKWYNGKTWSVIFQFFDTFSIFQNFQYSRN